jgi:hypothetical protein
LAVLASLRGEDDGSATAVLAEPLTIIQIGLLLVAEIADVVALRTGRKTDAAAGRGSARVVRWQSVFGGRDRPGSCGLSAVGQWLLDHREDMNVLAGQRHDFVDMPRAAYLRLCRGQDYAAWAGSGSGLTWPARGAGQAAVGIVRA